MIQLPPIITMGDFGGNFNAFLAAAYAIYKRDFVDNRPSFRKKKIGLKRLPIIDGMEKSFYHFTHSGDIENERIPDMRRMERIGWIAEMINNSDDPSLKVWRNKRGSNERILIFHEQESYLVILDDRKDYILPWTAYYIEYPNRKKSLLKEYEDYIKS